MHDPVAELGPLIDTVKAHIDPKDPGPETDDASEVAAYWVRRYFESRGYTYYPRARIARPEMAKLAGSGWLRKWRVPSMVDPTRRAPMPKADPLVGDSVAKVVRGICVLETLVRTPQELIGEAKREVEREASEFQDPPSNSRELHEHLVRIAPALQARRLFVDREKVNFFYEFLNGWLPKNPSKYSSYGYVRTSTGRALGALRGCGCSQSSSRLGAKTISSTCGRYGRRRRCSGRWQKAWTSRSTMLQAMTKTEKFVRP